jgi:flagellar FliJ protein
MKRFRFPLETLLRLNIRREDLMRHALLLSQAALREAEEDLGRLNVRQVRLREEFGELVVSRVNNQSLQLFQAFWLRLAGEIEVQSRVVLDCREEVEKRRGELVEARRNRLVVDKLKQKRLAGYRREYLREEQSFIDEVAGSQLRRQGSGA